MRPVARVLATLGLVAAAACGGDTAIIVEVSWDGAPPADTLRIYVGTATSAAEQTVINSGATTVAFAGLPSPYRYQLRPDGELDVIGPLQFAAGLTRGTPPDSIEAVAFAAAPTTIGFVDGEIRIVRLTLSAQPYTPAGAGAECALFDAVDGSPRSIGNPGDADCDRSPDAEDCAPWNPRVTPNNLDGDPAICNDCLDGDRPVIIHGRPIKPGSVFPGQTLEAFMLANGISDTVECMHVDFDCSGKCGDEVDSDGGAPHPPDGDRSGGNTCGSPFRPANSIACDPMPSDCEEADGQNTTVFGDPEVCDGRDSNCDGRPSTPVPCAVQVGAPIGCQVGVRVCNDVLGTYPEVCEPIGFPHNIDAAACGELNRALGCMFDDDPLDCSPIVDPIVCNASVVRTVGGTCDNVTQLPGDTSSSQCDWRIVGGVAQGDWDVGFVNAATAGLAPATTACGPKLAVRAAVESPHPHTVMLVGTTQIGLMPVVRFVTLRANSDLCGPLQCPLFPG